MFKETNEATLLQDSNSIVTPLKRGAHPSSEGPLPGGFMVASNGKLPSPLEEGHRLLYAIGLPALPRGAPPRCPNVKYG